MVKEKIVNLEKVSLYQRIRNITLWIALFILLLIIGFAVGWYNGYNYAFNVVWDLQEMICRLIEI